MARGKGKRGGGRGGRGGGGRRMFITNAEELELNNRRQETLGRLRAERRAAAGAGSDSDSEEGDDDEEKSGSEEEAQNQDTGFTFDRGGKNEAEGNDDSESGDDEEQTQRKPKSAVEGLIEISNPNKAAKQNHDRGIKLKDLKKMNFDDDTKPEAKAEAPLTRREREEKQKQDAKEAYMRKHKEGKTDEAKKDMERLAEIRKRREEAAKKREEEMKDAEEMKTRLEAEVNAANSAASKIPKLDAREIKKMNPTLLKEHLQELGLSIQGSKKDLLDRLIKAHQDL